MQDTLFKEILVLLFPQSTPTVKLSLVQPVTFVIQDSIYQVDIVWLQILTVLLTIPTVVLAKHAQVDIILAQDSAL
jgi:hypothetical protein